MNQSFRSLFNAALGTWVAVPEISRSCGARSSRSVAGSAMAAIAALFILTPLQQALAQAQPVAPTTLPTGQVVRSGAADFVATGNVLEVQQKSARLQTDWDTFSIGKDASVKFIQPSAASVALNRVTGADGSQILGRLEANGQVFLINPNGVLFGSGAQVNVGSLVASTLGMTDADFRAGFNDFSGASTATVENQGSLTAASGGAIALIGAKVVNSGTITAPQGNALLGAGNAVTLDFGGPVRINVTQAAVKAQVDNGGVIAANGGQIVLSAKGASDLAGAAINQNGTLEASSLAQSAGGRIALITDGTLTHAGRSTANAVDGTGGRIDASAASVKGAGQWQAVSANGRGGNIQVTSSGEFQTVNSAGSMSPVTMDVSGRTGGGDIGIDAASTLWVSSSVLSANSGQGLGGNIRLAAGGVLAAPSTSIEAIGGSGGGQVAYATRAAIDFMDSSAKVNASQAGNGGSVIIQGSNRVLIGGASAFEAKGAGVSGAGGIVRFVSGAPTSPVLNSQVDVSGSGAGANGAIQIQGATVEIGQSTRAGVLGKWLDDGARVTLTADNDLTLNSAITSTSASAGNLVLNAGRSILVNANIIQASGDLTLNANQPVSADIRNANRAAGAAHITMATGTSISGNQVAFAVNDGQGLSNAQTGTITLGTVSARGLTVTSPNVTATFQAGDKTYDRTTAATGGNWQASGLGFTADSNLSLTASDYAFADRNAGVSKAVSATAQLTGFNGTATTGIQTSAGALKGTGSATIAQRVLDVTATARDKTYDGTTQATVGSLNYTALGSDDVSVSASGAQFADKNAGQAKQVTVSGVALAGQDKDNYRLVATSVDTTASIAQRTLNVGIQAQDKVYDGQVNATVTVTDDRLAGDVLSVGTAGSTFANKNAGVGKTVTATGLTLAGQDAQNYQLAQTTATDTATISKRTLTPTATAANKTYDGNTGASVTIADDAVAGDSLSVRSTGAQFENKNAGLNKQVQISGLYLDGADRDNYVLSTLTATAQANIDRRVLNAVVTVQDKVYDGSTAAQIKSFASDKVAGDDVSLSNQSANFVDKNVGQNKDVTVNGLALSGADKDNYLLSAPTYSTQASITPRTLNLVTLADNKIYDGNTSAVVHLSDDRVAGDALQVTHQSANFADRQAGRDKRVVIDGIGLTGADKDNYVVVSNATDRADITPRTLNVTVRADNKVYDGGVRATVSLVDDRVAGDLLTLRNTEANFDNKNVGSGKTVTVQGVAISGADQGNYAVALTTIQGQADVTPRTLNVVANVADKVYDGATQARVSALADDRVAGDELEVTAARAGFADKNVGVKKTATVSGLSLSGTDSGNYVVMQDPVTASASITPRELLVQATVDGKVYDGKVATTVNGLTDNRVAGDDLTIGAAGANFDDKNVGKGKNATVHGLSVDGADSGNYVLAAAPVMAQADVTARTLHVTARAQDKVYDSFTKATASLSDDRVAGDEVVVNQGSANFSDKHAAQGKTVTVAGLTLAGTDGGNYQLSQSEVTAQASITPRLINVTVVPSQKDADGTNLAMVKVITAPLPSDQATAQWGEARFNDERPGMDKRVTVTDLALVGSDAGNYQLASTQAYADGAVIRPQPVLQGTQSACSSSGAAAACSAGTWLLSMNLASQSVIGGRGGLNAGGIDPLTGKPRKQADGTSPSSLMPKSLTQQGHGIQLPAEADQNRP
ncbi:YDG domain-containing protein [Roseateles amylovorans]|uniref:YDG domain-containing protein n=1 Tax=Roseateles amylovorans TaxID=2978473 RepID=A0ABY6B3K4_9BURK|nr:YDG domain-containing protein [Roseateles amylovorans]UXH79966.1 YDG domain-containing protein [Roseateles amylovorans]